MGDSGIELKGILVNNYSVPEELAIQLLEDSVNSNVITQLINHLKAKHKEICVKGSASIISNIKNTSQSEISLKNESIIKLEAEASNLTKSIERLTSEKAALDSEKTQLTKELNTFKQNESLINEKAAKIAETESELKQTREQLVTQRELLAKAQSDLDKLEDEKAEIAKKQLESEQKSSSLYFKITSFDSEIATLKSERAEENMKNSIVIQDLKSKVEELEQTVTLKNSQIDDLTKQLNNIKSNGSGLNHSSHYDSDTVKEKDLEIADLKNKISSLESIKAKEANDHSILRNNQQMTIDKLSSTNMEQFKQIETLRNRVGCLEKVVVDKENLVTEYKSKLDSLNNQHTELKSQIDINQDHNSILPSMPSLITIHEALKSNGLDISEMQSENFSLKRVNQSLLSQKNSIVQIFNQALEDIYSIGPEYKERLQGFEGLYSKFVDISNQYQNIKNENFGLKIENSKLESSKKDLDNTINSLYNRQSILIQILIQVASFQDVDNFDVSQYVTPEDFERIKNLCISSNLNFSSFQEFAKSFIKIADLLETKHKSWDQREEQILNSLKEIEPTINGSLDQAIAILKSKMDKAMLDMKLITNELSNLRSTSNGNKSGASASTTNQALESKCQSLVKKLEALEKTYEEDKNKFKKQITLLKDAKLELECENSTFNIQIKNLKDEKERYKARAEEIQNKIFVFNKDTDSLVNELKSFDVFGYKDQFKRLNSDIDKLREQLKSTTDQLNDYKKKSSEFENLYNNAQLSLDQERTLTKALKVYEDQFEAISAQIRQSEAEAIFKLKSEKQSLEAKINTLNNESAQNQKNFQAKISQLEQTINSDVLKFNELSNNLIECQAELKSAQAQVAELEGIKTSFEARIEALKNSKDLRTPAQVKQYVDSIKAEKKAIESQLKEALDEKDQKLKLVVSYETTIASLTTQITENKKEYDQAISEKDTEISQIKSNLSNVQSMLDSEFSKSEKYKAQAEDCQSQIESLTQSQENLKIEIESIKEKYNSDRSELESNIALLEKQLDELNNSKNEELLNVLDWTQKIADAKAERDSLQAELERAKIQLKDTSSSLEDYKNEIKLVNSKFDSEISKLKAKNDELEFSNTTLRNQFVSASRTQLTPDSQRIDELNKDLISQIGHLKSQLSATELQIKLLNDQFKSKEAELSSVQATLEIEKQKLLSIQPSSTLIEKVNSLTQDSEIQKSEISQLKDQLAEKETRANELIRQKDAIKSELDSLKDKSNNDTSTIKKLEQDVAVYKLQAENWMERYKASTQNQEAIDPDEFANLKCSNEALIKEKTDLQTRLQQFINGIKLRNARIKELESYKANHPHTKEAFDAKNKELEELNTKFDQLRTASESIKTELDTQVKKYQSAIQSAKNMKNFYDGRLNDANSKINEFKGQIADYQSKLEKLEKAPVQISQGIESSPVNTASLNPNAPSFTPKQVPSTQVQSQPQAQSQSQPQSQVQTQQQPQAQVQVQTQTQPQPHPVQNSLAAPDAVISTTESSAPVKADPEVNLVAQNAQPAEDSHDVNDSAPVAITEPPQENKVNEDTNTDTAQVAESQTLDSKPVGDSLEQSIPVEEGANHPTVSEPNLVALGEPENPPQPRWLMPQHSDAQQSFSPIVTPTPGKRNIDSVEGDQGLNDLNLPSPQTIPQEPSQSPKKQKQDDTPSSTLVNPPTQVEDLNVPVPVESETVPQPDTIEQPIAEPQESQNETQN